MTLCTATQKRMKHGNAFPRDFLTQLSGVLKTALKAKACGDVGMQVDQETSKQVEDQSRLSRNSSQGHQGRSPLRAGAPGSAILITSQVRDAPSPPRPRRGGVRGGMVRWRYANGRFLPLPAVTGEPLYGVWSVIPSPLGVRLLAAEG
jgi:hypothetical protein